MYLIQLGTKAVVIALGQKESVVWSSPLKEEGNDWLSSLEAGTFKEAFESVLELSYTGDLRNFWLKELYQAKIDLAGRSPKRVIYES